MSVRRLADDQPASFEFTPDNKAWLERQIAKYPDGRQASAVIPALWQAQKQNGYWLPRAAIEKVAEELGTELSMSQWLVIMSTYVGRVMTEPDKFILTSDVTQIHREP